MHDLHRIREISSDRGGVRFGCLHREYCHLILEPGHNPDDIVGAQIACAMHAKRDRILNEQDASVAAVGHTGKR